MTHTRHPGLTATWTQKIGRKNYIRVFVWATHDDINRVSDVEYSIDGQARSGWTFHTRTGQRLAGKKFGELHFVRDLIGAGLAAHEIQHLVNYWTRFKGYDIEIDTEKIAEFAEKVTRDFWNEFYKRFTVDQA